jgi:hypothetical protein
MAECKQSGQKRQSLTQAKRRGGLGQRAYVVYWNNIPSPYMVERFNAVADLDNLEFEAWFNGRIESDRSWEVVESQWRFRYRYLPTTRLLGQTQRWPVPVLGRRADVIISYAIFSLSIAVLVVNARGDALRLLALTAALTVGVFLFSFLSIALQAGVPVIQYAVLSIQSGDPDILIFRVFRRVMLAGAEDNLDEVKANLRHEIGMGLLLAALVSVCFSKAITDTRALVIVYAASGVAILLAMLTLSRATIVIGVFVTVIVIFGKLASARSVNRGLSVVLSFSLLMTVALIFTPLGELVLARFAQAESYNQRSSAIVDSIAVIANNPVFPDDASSVYIRSGNSHIVLLEMWKYGGAAGAAAAALLFVALGVSLLQGLTGSEARGRATRHRSPDRLVASALLCFPIVRYLTAGSGLGITDWVAIGLALGCFTLGNASKTSYTDRGLTLRASTRSFHSPRSAS